MVEIIGNANFVQRCESCCDMEKKRDILIYLDHYEQVSGSLDGKLIVWDSWTGNKIQVDSKFVVMCFRNGGLHAS